MTIRWFACKPGAKWMPFPCFTTSNDWATDQGINCKIGEIYGAPRVFEYNTANPAALGEHFCGTEDWWYYGQPIEDGVPETIYLPNGLPTCCGEINVTAICTCRTISGNASKIYHESSNTCTCVSVLGAETSTWSESGTICTCASVLGDDEPLPEEQSTICTCASVLGDDEPLPEEQSTICTCAAPSGEFICCVPGDHTVITQAGTCSFANVCSPTNTYFFTTTTDTLAWFKFDPPDGETWYFKVSTPCNSDLGGAYTLYSGTDCGSLTVISVGVFDCQSFTGPGPFWVSIVINHDGGCVFVTCGTGTCP